MKKLEKGLDFAMSTIMSIVMLVLLIFGTWQIFTRWILNDPSTFTEEMLRYLLIWAGMIGAAYCFFHDKHVKLTLLTSKLHGPALTVATIFNEIIVVLFVLYVYVYGGGQMMMRTMASGQLTAVLRLPMSLIYACRYPACSSFCPRSSAICRCMRSPKLRKGANKSWVLYRQH